MKLTMKLGKQSVEIPNELTYPQYKRLRQYKDNPTPTQILAAVTGIPEKEIKKADLKSIEEISEVVSLFYFSGTTDDETIVSFEHKGVEYGLQTDFGKLAYGAWIDLEVYASQDIEENIPKILARLYYPIKKKKGSKLILEEYSEELMEESEEAFKDVPIKIWFGATSFFLLFVKTYIEDMKTSLKWKNKYQRMQMRGLMLLPKFLQKRLLPGFISAH